MYYLVIKIHKTNKLVFPMTKTYDSYVVDRIEGPGAGMPSLHKETHIKAAKSRILDFNKYIYPAVID